MYDGGNQVYDSFMLSPSYLGIVKAIPFVRSSLGSLSYEEELFVLSRRLIQVRNLLRVFTSAEDLPAQMLLLL